MAGSVLQGANVILAWSDFRGGVPADRAAGDDAFTSASYSVQAGFTWTGRDATKSYHIDTVQITVMLDRIAMWSVASKRTPSLLRHEQGHYDIVALAARDLYNDLMELKKSSFASEDEAKDAVEAAKDPLALLIGKLESNNGDGVYDTNTDHGMNAKNQEKWNNAFSKARTAGARLADALKAWNVYP